MNAVVVDRGCEQPGILSHRMSQKILICRIDSLSRVMSRVVLVTVVHLLTVLLAFQNYY